MTIATGTMYHTSELTVRHCPKCGVPYAMPQRLYEKKRDNGEDWYCPNGHPIVMKQNEAERWRRRAMTAQSDLDQKVTELQHVRRSKSAIKGQLTRTKKRVGNGVCPCCQRQFKQLHRHMKNQHPEYIEQQD